MVFNHRGCNSSVHFVKGKKIAVLLSVMVEALFTR